MELELGVGKRLPRSVGHGEGNEQSDAACRQARIRTQEQYPYVSQRMTQDYHLYYQLYPYRSAQPRARLSVIGHETVTSLGLVHGIASIIGTELQKRSEVPPSLHRAQQELSQVAAALLSLRERLCSQEASGETSPPSPEERLHVFRDEGLPLADTLRTAAKSLQASGLDLKNILPDAEIWIERVVQATEHIWVTLDCMTNAHLELPSFLTDWLKIRDRIRSQVLTGDFQALEPLWQALQNPESDIRREAAILLGHIKDSRSVGPLIAALNDPVIEVRTDAAETLGILVDKRAADALHLAIPRIGNAAAIALHRLGDPRGKEYVLSVLRDGDLEQRRSAVTILGTLHDSTVIETLIANLNDPDRGVRWGAAWSLGELRDPRAVKPLIMALAEEVQITPKDIIETYPARAVLRSALTRIGGPEAAWALEHYT